MSGGSYDALSLTKMPFDSKRCFRQQEVVSITRGVPITRGSLDNKGVSDNKR